MAVTCKQKQSRQRAIVRTVCTTFFPALAVCQAIASLARQRWLRRLGPSAGSCKGKGGSMHLAYVDQGMLGANDVGTLAVPMGQTAAVSTGDGPVTIAGQGQMSIATLARS